MECVLCGSHTTFYSIAHHRTYHSCDTCHGILLDASHFLTIDEEKKRYEAHNNDVDDTGYQKFVSPIVHEILKNHHSEHLGLDFGSGSGPVISTMLREKEYTIKTYDPFFEPNTQALKSTYDYIACCEVMEHFYNPKKEFHLLYSLLKPRGVLYCKTNLYNDTIDFKSWWYKNDPTHVFFYTKETLLWIKEQYSFSFLQVSKNLIVFTK